MRIVLLAILFAVVPIAAGAQQTEGCRTQALLVATAEMAYSGQDPYDHMLEASQIMDADLSAGRYPLYERRVARLTLNRTITLGEAARLWRLSARVRRMRTRCAILP
jgi:hypothetical protein